MHMKLHNLVSVCTTIHNFVDAVQSPLFASYAVAIGLNLVNPAAAGQHGLLGLPADPALVFSA